MVRAKGTLNVSFTKMEGTGNDFIMVNAIARPLDIDWPSFARRFCPAKTGVGADGVIVLSPDKQTDFRFRIFNADGSEAEMCGNGARCAAWFAMDEGIAGDAMRFSTMAGIIGARIEGEEVAIQMTDPFGIATGIDIPVQGAVRTVHFINTGVPHAILFSERIEEEPVFELGRAVRRHDRFAPAGTNADFVQVLGPDSIHVRTYERGVEDETYACGTGAVASAIISYHLGKVSKDPVAVRMKGGDLKIAFFHEKGTYSQVWLIGNVSAVFTGKVSVNP